MIRRYLACDLGAESGRIILGTLDGGILRIRELHRFSNGGIRVDGHLCWDVDRILAEIQTGMTLAGREKLAIESISCDSWGVDYVLMKNGRILRSPFHYRDTRTMGAFERAFAVVSQEEIFGQTGVQFMPINTLYQLHDDLLNRPQILHEADNMLTMADYFNERLCGTAVIEESLASTTQLYDPLARSWSGKLIERFGIPPHLFPSLSNSGSVLDPLLPDVASHTGLGMCRVVAGLSHDTAAAVAAVPASSDSWAYVSSGTWSLIGVELSSPLISHQSLKLNFTNEVGFRGSIRFLKNIPGMWIIQECRRFWSSTGRAYSYEELTDLADQAPSGPLIDPHHERFVSPPNMVQEIVSACREQGQPIPDSPGAVVRCVLGSLAREYGEKLGQIEALTGRRIDVLHVVGGGSRNRLLNRLTADAIGRTVLAGPVECTAIGNILAQAIALGHVESLSAAREIVRASFELVEVQPGNHETTRVANRAREVPR